MGPKVEQKEEEFRRVQDELNSMRNELHALLNERGQVEATKHIAGRLEVKKGPPSGQLARFLAGG
jgi:hypothetical protein